MIEHRIPEPFHAGELLAQERAGGGPAGAPIRSRMPEQHREFFPLLPFVAVALPDAGGWPIATLLQGAPGFASSPGADQLLLDAAPDPDDPARAFLTEGAEIGLLGIDLSTRRRNRANGRIARSDGGRVLVQVDQSFGNCPKYIRVRQLEPARPRPAPVETFGAELPQQARALVAACETMFVASSSGDAVSDRGRGLDVSHRGGEVGFLRLDGDVITVPDYAGNRYFNTLGNLLLEPRAALLLVDFASGDLLQLQGRAKVLWEEPGLPGPVRAERAWEFQVRRGWLRRGALALRSS